MVKVRFVFHKPQGERFVGKAIVVWTWILGLFYNWKVLRYNYSHEEVWLPDKNATDGYFIYANPMFETNIKYNPKYFGQCFSSTTRGKWKGVRFAPACEVLGKHPERWDYIEVEVDEERYKIGIEEAERLADKRCGYDYGYILSFLQPFLLQKDSDWACSEVCMWLGYLWRAVAKRFKRISPRRAAQVLAKRWGEPQSLV